MATTEARIDRLESRLDRTEEIVWKLLNRTSDLDKSLTALNRRDRQLSEVTATKQDSNEALEEALREVEYLKSRVSALERRLERNKPDDDSLVFGKSMAFWSNHALVLAWFVIINALLWLIARDVVRNILE
jgi:chromosome segregation ATPase